MIRFSNWRYVIILLVVLVGCNGVPTPQTVPPRSSTTLTPSRIGFDAPEIANPGRGLYRWRRQTMMCPAELKSDRDDFNRWHWSDLETAEGVYDWSAVRTFIDGAAARGQRAWLGLGVSAGPARDGPYMPTYMLQPGWGAEWAGEWYPDYNNPAVQARLTALLDDFVREFGDDPWIAGVQMLSYGRYGEGYVPWDAPLDHPMHISDATAEWLIDAWHTRLSGAYHLSIPLHNRYVFYYAMTKTPLWGLTRDALGYQAQMENIDTAINSELVIDGVAIGPAVRDRWKYAPVFTEAIGESDLPDYSGQFAASLTQVVSYHVSLVSNGNFAHPYKEGPWDFWAKGEDCTPQPTAWTAQNVADFVLAGKRAGYRYAPLRLTISEAADGQTMTWRTEWLNEGVAPIYEPWRVRLQLRPVNAPQTIAWEAESQVQLTEILPNTPDQPTTIEDTFPLPPTLATGLYRVHIVVPPIAPYSTALQLAITGKQADGSYSIGEISLRCGTDGVCVTSK